MATDEEASTAQPHPSGPALGYEPRDMSAKGVGQILAALGATLAAMIGVVFLLLHFYSVRNRAEERPLTREERILLLPPLPRLQATVLGEIDRLRARDRKALDSYAWLGADHRTARIPIARAMTLVVGRSLDAPP